MSDVLRSEQSAQSIPTNADAGRTNFRTSVINLERPGNPDVFGEQIRRDAANLIGRYPEGQARSALLPLLHLVQSEQGCITPDGIAFCSDVLGITKAQVSAVATFYTMYKRTPTGEYLVSVCTNTLCGLLGGDEIYAAVSEQLGVGNNESTPDGLFTIERAECLAACDYAPVVTVNYEFYDNQTVESTSELLGKLAAGDRPLPTRGAPLCSFKQAERQIAGFFTVEDYALEATASGAPTEAGVRLALQRGDSAPSYAVDDSSSRTGADAEASAQGGQQGPSQDDAPLSTAESDSSNSTGSGASRDS
ncbi:NADH-quinone oxidoreductase subunit NuoE [uncultured Jatrophihabitans sp.]|uniref:NADH-quinone oxidoreductase subunit NuoE n=1 Tax=uncultured Jatrophihabitans sp. TaxID=1610747 RepID=UPI0035CAD0CE